MRANLGRLVAVLGLVAGATGQAGAEHIHYNEAVSGDLPTFPDNAPIFALDDGVNTVAGTVTLAAGDSPLLDFDAFRFTVPTGSVLQTIEFEIAQGTGPGIFGLVSMELRREGDPSFRFFNDRLIPSHSFLFEGPLPLEAGLYGLRTSGFAGSGSGSRSAPYRLTLTTGIPEPSTLALCGPVALAGAVLGWRRRRRRMIALA